MQPDVPKRSAIAVAVLAFAAACGSPAPDQRPHAINASAPRSLTKRPLAGEPSFVLLADLRFEPRQRGEVVEAERSAPTLAWLTKAMWHPEAWAAGGPVPPQPGFALVAGGLTEFGAVGDTWHAVERGLDSLGVPWYATPGQRDNTWAPIGDGMRARFRAWTYSFERAGWHFVALNTATLCDPHPTLAPAVLAWLRADLAHATKGAPIAILMHLPPDAEELAQPAQLDQFLDAIDGFPVTLVISGRGEVGLHRNLAGLDCLEPGSAIAEPASGGRGATLVSIAGGRLRAVHRSVDDERAPEVLLDEKWPRDDTTSEPFEILSPPDPAVVRESTLPLRVRAPIHAKVEVAIDGEPAGVPVTSSTAVWTAQLPLPTAGGVHLLRVTARLPDGEVRVRTRTFATPDRDVEVRWRRQLASGIRATPHVSGDFVIVATGAGEVASLSRKSGEVEWITQLSAEVLGEPAEFEDRIVVASGDGWINAFARDGARKWRFQAGAPVYAPPLASDGVVYVGNMAGTMVALDAWTGERLWFFDSGGFPIEARAARVGELLVFTAWNGHVVALEARTGRERWRGFNATVEASADRRDVPANCAPAIVGERAWLCDGRGALVGFDFAGAPTLVDAFECGSIAGSPSRDALTLRTVAGKLVRADAGGTKLWEADSGGGRIPTAPVEVAGRIAAVSDRGIVTLVAADSGAILWQWRSTPGTYALSAPALDDEGAVYIGALDGAITALRARTRDGEARDGER